MITCGTQIVSGAPIYGGGGGGDVPSSRTITAGTGLTGGGDLSADRTLAVSFGSTGTTACVGNDSRLSNARTPTAHAASHGGGGTDPITIASTQVTGLGGAALLSVGTSAGTVAAGDDSRIVGAVQTSRTIAGLALSNNITASALNTALGSSASLGVRTLAPDTGWTNTIGTNQPGGTASVSIAAGVHTFTGQGGGFAIETRPAISTPECPAVEWMGRFTVVTGNPTNAWYTSLSITSATDSAGYLAQVLTDQTVSLYVRAEGGSWTLVSVGPGLIPLVSGTWIRLVVTPTYAAAYWGASGSSTPPSFWFLSSSVATTVAMLAGRSLTHFGVRQGRTGAGAAVTTEWTDLQYRILGVSP